MEQIIHNYTQTLDGSVAIGIEVFLYMMGMLCLIIGIQLLVEDTIQWFSLIKHPEISTFASAWTYAFLYTPMFIFFLTRDTSVLTFFITLVIYAVLYGGFTWFRIGRFNTEWKFRVAILNYLQSQIHVALLVIGSICLKIVLLFVQSRIG